MALVRFVVLLTLGLWVSCDVRAADGPAPRLSSDDPDNATPTPPPPVRKEVEIDPNAINWNGIASQSSLFLGIEHGFRFATEAGTRSGMKGPFFRGYLNAVGNMHGWSDGDPFLVNYIGHPLQGSVASFIWIQNDAQRYRLAEFGESRDYWKSRLRATAWSWAYSTQFEIGPLSEASLGKVQNTWPQQGFVDHVITPAVGLGWTLAEDAIDKYIIKRFEERVENKWARMMVRGWLNPGRSAANALAFRAPWSRDTRSGILAYQPVTYLPKKKDDEPDAPPKLLASFEFLAQPTFQRFGNHNCLGGGASGAFRVNPSWQIVVDVSGCTVYGLGENRSGDTLLYQIGPRWTPSASGRFSPYAEFLVGGHKVTQTYTDPVGKAAWEKLAKEQDQSLPPPKPDFMDFQEANAFAVKAATGLDMKLTSALALRLASLGYTHTWTSPMNGVNYSNGLQFSTGIVLRMGTW